MELPNMHAHAYRHTHTHTHTKTKQKQKQKGTKKKIQQQSANHSHSLRWEWNTAPWEFQTKQLHYFFMSNNKSNLHSFMPSLYPVYNLLWAHAMQCLRRPNVILTRQTYGQRSSIVAGSKCRALAFYCFVEIWYVFPKSKCRGESDLGLCTSPVLAKRMWLRSADFRWNCVFGRKFCRKTALRRCILFRR